MFKHWKETLAVLSTALLVVVVGSLSLAAKGGKGKGGGEELTGTIYFMDAANTDWKQIAGMNPDGSGKFRPFSPGIKGAPSRLVYGNDDHRWWLTTAAIPGEDRYPDGSRRREAFGKDPIAWVP